MSGTNLLSDLKVAWLTATGTLGTGLATVVEMIPNDIGKLATVVGIVLSSVLIYTHLRKGRAETEKLQLEILILKEKEADSIEAARRRRGAG
jgi:hypothetical protein